MLHAAQQRAGVQVVSEPKKKYGIKYFIIKTQKLLAVALCCILA